MSPLIIGCSTYSSNGIHWKHTNNHQERLLACATRTFQHVQEKSNCNILIIYYLCGLDLKIVDDDLIREWFQHTDEEQIRFLERNVVSMSKSYNLWKLCIYLKNTTQGQIWLWSCGFLSRKTRFIVMFFDLITPVSSLTSLTAPEKISSDSLINPVGSFHRPVFDEVQYFSCTTST